MKNKKTIIIAIVAIIAVVAIIGGALVSSYNGLVPAQENVTSAQSDIDTMLQRRADLIPNIVATVKDFAEHETEVYDKVLEARQNLLNAN